MAALTQTVLSSRHPLLFSRSLIVIICWKNPSRYENQVIYKRFLFFVASSKRHSISHIINLKIRILPAFHVSRNARVSAHMESAGFTITMCIQVEMLVFITIEIGYKINTIICQIDLHFFLAVIISKLCGLNTISSSLSLTHT